MSKEKFVIFINLVIKSKLMFTKKKKKLVNQIGKQLSLRYVKIDDHVSSAKMQTTDTGNS